jgi:hypothetical protein
MPQHWFEERSNCGVREGRRESQGHSASGGIKCERGEMRGAHRRSAPPPSLRRNLQHQALKTPSSQAWGDRPRLAFQNQSTVFALAWPSARLGAQKKEGDKAGSGRGAVAGKLPPCHSALWKPIVSAHRQAQPPVRVQRCTRAWQNPHDSCATISAATGSKAGAPLLLAAGGALPQREG